jgi:glucosyl-dolichyl phosphate glucuronosyltransferase
LGLSELIFQSAIWEQNEIDCQVSEGKRMSDSDQQGATTPIVSVIICTRNRADSLARTLTSLVVAASHVEIPWELQVVDNGSIDKTQAVVSSFEGKLPIRLIVENTPGLSNARNAGVAKARGHYILWTDDDVIVDENWLSAYIAAFAKYPDCALFGGAATPLYEAPIQPWFVARERQLDGLLAIRYNPEWHEITQSRLPYGLNYAIRAVEQRTFPYDPDLGVAPGRRRGGEEIAVICAALAAGAKGVWVWDAKVHHMIPSHRQTSRYIWQFYRAQGYDFPVMPLTGTGIGVGGVAFKLAHRVARRWVGRTIRKWSGRDSWLLSHIELARTLGSIDRLRERQN